MRKISWLKSTLAFVMVGVLLVSGTGCDLLPDDIADEVMGFLMEWSDAHDVNPQTPGGAVNLAKRAASGSTGNEDADAIIGAFKPLEDIKKADKDMEQGRQLRAQGKLSEAADSMDDAIAARPKDYSYRLSRASLAFQADDRNIAVEQMRAARRASPAPGWKAEEGSPDLKPPKALVQFYTQTIDELESSAIKPSKMRNRTGAIYYNELFRAYANRYGLTRSELDKERSIYYAKMADDLRLLKPDEYN